MTLTGKTAPPPKATAKSPAARPQQVPPVQYLHVPWNLGWLVIQQVVVRVGWIFKTESVIMPAFFDAIAGAAGAGSLRSWLPLLNRFGQSLPPLLLSGWLRSLRQKKWFFAAFCGLMAASFLVIAIVIFNGWGMGSRWLPILCLGLYGLFFCGVGLHNLSFGTTQGKLIPATLRGRLLATSAFLGACGAVSCAWWLMTAWLSLPDGVGFGYCFGFAGGCFLIGSMCVLALREPRDAAPHKSNGLVRHLAGSWQLFRRDANFRRLAAVAMLFSTTLILFPHYQALAREKLNLAGSQLMVWVIVQNLAIGICSLLLGPLADARGNRLTLRTVIFLTSLTPALAIVMTHIDPEVGRRWFWLIFAPLGFTPITIKTMNNYTLEICSASEHPRYLSTLSICLALPFCLSPVVGWLIGIVGFDAVFLCGAGVVLLCGLLTFRLAEPRHGPGPPDPEPVTMES